MGVLQVQHIPNVGGIKDGSEPPPSFPPLKGEGGDRAANSISDETSSGHTQHSNPKAGYAHSISCALLLVVLGLGHLFLGRARFGFGNGLGPFWLALVLAHRLCRFRRLCGADRNVF